MGDFFMLKNKTIAFEDFIFVSWMYTGGTSFTDLFIPDNFVGADL